MPEHTKAEKRKNIAARRAPVKAARRAAPRRAAPTRRRR